MRKGKSLFTVKTKQKRPLLRSFLWPVAVTPNAHLMHSPSLAHGRLEPLELEAPSSIQSSRLELEARQGAEVRGKQRGAEGL